MLMPKRVKRRRVQRGRMKGIASRGNKISYGEFGLMAMGPAWVTSNQIEAARIAMTRYIRRGGKVWIKIFPHKPVTEKPAETRMGSGKGSPEYWVAVVKPGRIMFEIAGVPEETAKEALRRAMHKLPVKCKFVTRREQEAAESGGKANKGDDAADAGDVEAAVAAPDVEGQGEGETIVVVVDEGAEEGSEEGSEEGQPGAEPVTEKAEEKEVAEPVEAKVEKRKAAEPAEDKAEKQSGVEPVVIEEAEKAGNVAEEE